MSDRKREREGEQESEGERTTTKRSVIAMSNCFSSSFPTSIISFLNVPSLQNDPSNFNAYST